MRYSSESKKSKSMQIRMSGNLDITAGFSSDGSGELTITMVNECAKAVFSLDKDAATVIYDAISGYLAPRGADGRIVSGGEAIAQ